MTNRRALRLLHKQLAAIDALENEDQARRWANHTRALVLHLFEEGTEEHMIMQGLSMSHFNYGGGGANTAMFRRETINDAKSRLERAIEAVKLRGVHKKAEPNWLYHMDKRWLGAIITAISVLVIGATTFIAKWNASKENDSLREENRLLHDSLLISRRDVSKYEARDHADSIARKAKEGDTQQEVVIHDTLGR